MDRKQPNQPNKNSENGRRQNHPSEKGRDGGRGGRGGRGGGRGGGRSSGKERRGTSKARREETGNLVTPKAEAKPKSWNEVVKTGTKRLTITPILMKFEKSEDVKNVIEEAGTEAPVWTVPSPKKKGCQVQKQTEKEGSKPDGNKNRYEVLSEEEDEEEKVEVEVVKTKEGKKERKGKEQQSNHQQSGQKEISKRKKNSKKKVNTPKQDDTMTEEKSIKWKDNTTKPRNQQKGDSGPVEEAQQQDTGIKPDQKKFSGHDVKMCRVFQMVRDLADQGKMTKKCVEKLNKTDQNHVLVSMATTSILERTDAFHPDDVKDSETVFQYLSTLSTKSLLKIINDRDGFDETKAHADEIEQQKKNDTIGQTTELLCKETVNDLINRESIDGEELDEVIKEWVQRFYPGCGKRFHVRCISVSSRARCEECVEANPYSSDEESETDSSSNSDSDESYTEENGMIQQSPRGRRRGQSISSRRHEPERVSCLSPDKGTEGGPHNSAKPPPESLRNGTTAPINSRTDRSKLEDPNKRDE